MIVGHSLVMARRTTTTTTGDPHWANCVLALRGDGTDGSTAFSDLSATPHGVTTNGNARVSTSQFKWPAYGSSLYLDGSGDFLSLSAGTSTAFGTGDFTVRAWIRPDADVASNARLLGNRMGTGTWLMFLRDGNKLALHTDISSPLDNLGTISPLTWSLVEIGRASGTAYAFVNGILLGSASFLENLASTTKPQVGAEPNGGPTFKGYLQDVQIYRGVCLNTTSYTPPTGPFTAG